MKNWYMLSYDVRDERRLKRVARVLEGFGTRLQYSVFRCCLSPRDLERLRWELTKVMDGEEDDLLIVGLCSTCVDHLRARNPKTNWPDESATFRIL